MHDFVHQLLEFCDELKLACADCNMIVTMSISFNTGWHKKRELLKNPPKIEEIQEKKLLTEIERL